MEYNLTYEAEEDDPFLIPDTKFGIHFDTSKCATGGNAELQIVLALRFFKIEPDRGTRYSWFTPRRWPRVDFEMFMYNFASRTTSFWDSRFWLRYDQPDDERWHFKTFDINATVWIPAIECRFLCVVREEPYKGKSDGWGRVIEVVRPFRPQRFRDSAIFMDHTALRVIKRKKEGAFYYQTTAYHEVGHLLGLEHINRWGQKCVEGGEPACYGETPAQRNALMGVGEAIGERDALPWQVAAVHAFQRRFQQDKTLAPFGAQPPTPFDFKVSLLPIKSEKVEQAPVGAGVGPYRPPRGGPSPARRG